MPDAAHSALGRPAVRLPSGRRQLRLLLSLWWRHMRRAAAARVTGYWLEGTYSVYGLYAGTLLLMAASYRALLAAERRGFDRLGIQDSAPRAYKGAQDRVSLEWRMMWRQGGKAQLIALGIIFLGSIWILLVRARHHLPPSVLLFFAGFTVYLGAIQTLAQAGRAARSDLLARAFLAALPLAPHQVLDGKARALRRLSTPVLATLLLLLGVGVWQGELGFSYRMLLSLLSLYVIVDGAVGVAFLSNGVGVVGVAGGQASSSFSTQLLMMPLLATVMATNDWSATVSFIAVLAVTLEARRAAKHSVRWLDDPDDALERETTVWRALLAATAFFAMQVLSVRLLDLFEVPQGYMMAIAFGLSGLLLALLTWRNGARLPRPRCPP